MVIDSSSLRILFLSTWYPYPPDNGSKIRVFHLLRALGKSHGVTLISFAFGTAGSAQRGDLLNYCVDVQAVQRNPFERGRIAQALRFFSLVPITTQPVPEMTQVVRKVLARDSFDVIIASTELMAAYARLAPNTAAKVLEEHNSLTHKRLGYSKLVEMHEAAAVWEDTVYSLTRPPKTLRLEVTNDPKRRWWPRTSAMAADLTDHIWTVKALLIWTRSSWEGILAYHHVHMGGEERPERVGYVVLPITRSLAKATTQKAH
jgi:hypothetical protein